MVCWVGLGWVAFGWNEVVTNPVFRSVYRRTNSCREPVTPAKSSRTDSSRWGISETKVAMGRKRLVLKLGLFGGACHGSSAP